MECNEYGKNKSNGKSSIINTQVINDYLKFDNKNPFLLKLLNEIIKYNPNINLIDIDDEILKNPIYVKEYGYSFLAQNIQNLKSEDLTCGTNDKEIKERILLIFKLGIPFENISKKLLFADIDNIFFVKCKSLLCNHMIISFINRNFIFDNNDIEYIYLISKNKKERKYFKFFIYNFYNIDKKSYKTIINHEKKYLHILINLLDNLNITLEMDINNFLKFYDENEILLHEIKNNINDSIKDNFRIYFNNYNFIKINNLKELLNIKNINYKYGRNEIINENNIVNIKNIITTTYFCTPIKDFLNLMHDILNHKEILTKEEYLIFKNIINTFEKDKLLYIFDNLYNTKNIYNLLINVIKKYELFCKKDIVKNLNKKENAFKIIYFKDKPIKVVYFNGQPLKKLIHVIKGNGYKKMAEKILSDPSFWIKENNENSYISCSLITDLFLGLIGISDIIFGFSNFNYDDILDMGPHDIMTSQKKLKSKRKNTMSRCLPTKELIEETDMKYDEVVIKRYRDKKVILPDYILCFNEPTEISKEIAILYNIPIHIVMVDAYIDKMNDNLEKLLENYEFQKYYNYRNKKYYSILEFNDLLSKEFNAETLFIEFQKIVNKMNEVVNDDNIDDFKKLLERLNNKNHKILKDYKNYAIQNENISKILKLTNNN